MEAESRQPFVEVRSLMQEPELNASQRASLRELLHLMYRDHQEEYLAQWLPYIQGFPQHFTRILGWFTDAEALEFASQYAPFARFGLDFVGSDHALIRLSQTSCFELLAAMVFSRQRASESAILTALRSPYLTRLEILHVRDARLVGHLAELLDLPCVSELEELDLSGSLIGGDDGARALAKHRALKGLKSLRLERCGIGLVGKHALERSSSLRGCRVIVGGKI